MGTSAPTASLNLPNDITYNPASPVRFFLYISLTGIAGLYFWLVWSSPTYTTGVAWTPEQWAFLSGALLVHAGLHWFSQYINSRHYRWAVLLVQTGLLFGVSLTLRYPAILLLLLPSMLGEVACVFVKPRWMLAIGLVFYILYAASSRSVYGGDIAFYILSSGFVLWLATNMPFSAALALEARSRQQSHRLLRELEVAHRQLAAYVEQVEQLTLAAERARMARELHDTLAQGLTGLILQMEALDAHLERGDTEQARVVSSHIRSHARSALANSRRAIDDLRILPEEPDSLIGAIKEEAERFSAMANIPCQLELPPTLVLPTSSTEHTLRFVTEGLANIARHAGASTAAVSVRLDGKAVIVEVRDNGIGFDPQAAMNRPGHYGLLGLHERARLAGGVLEVDSAIGRGTTLRMRLLLRNGGHARDDTPLDRR